MTFYDKIHTERCGRVIGAPVSYSEGPEFKSRTEE
jgi:hypothetical protein